MNALDLLNEKEKRIFSQMLTGLNMSEVADVNKCTPDDVNSVRLQIVTKLEQASPAKSLYLSHFQI